MGKYLTENYMFYAIVGILYYLQIRLYVGALDDIQYSYMHKVVDGRRINDYSHRIGSLYEAIQSQCVDYFYQNGRFVVHTLVQWLCGVSYGREVFFFVSSSIFILLINGLNKVIAYTVGDSWLTKYEVLVFLLILMPIPGITLFGNIACVINYLWTACAVTWALVVLHRVLLESRVFDLELSIVLGIFVLIAFALQESFSIPIAGAVFLCSLSRMKEWNWYKAFFMFAVTLGTLLVVVAPANFGRFEGSGAIGDGGLLKHIIINTIGLVYVSDLSVIIIGMAFAGILFYRRRITDIIKRNAFFLICICISFLFGICIVTTGSHQFSVVAIMLTIVLISEFSRTFDHLKYSQSMFIVIVSGLLLFNSVLYYSRYKFTQAWDAYVATANVDGYAHADELYDMFIEHPWWTEHYTSYTHCRWHFLVDSNAPVVGETGIWMDSNICSLPFSKERIMKLCAEKQAVCEGLYLMPGGDGFILKVPSVMADSLSIRYETIPSFMGKVLNHSNRLSTYELNNSSSRFFCVDGVYYRWISEIDPNVTTNLEIVRKK